MAKRQQQRRFTYIMGPARSGSTVLTFLLAEHPRIATIGELKATSRGNIADYRCSCGELIEACTFWKTLRDRASRLPGGFSLEDFGSHFSEYGTVEHAILYSSLRGRWFEALRNQAIRLHPGARRIHRRALQRNRDLVELITEILGKDVFLDGSKDPIRLRYLSSIDDWDIRVLLMIRDGRGTVFSYMRRYGLTLQEATREWRQACMEYREIDRYIDPSRIMTIRYEDLCDHPEETLAAVHEFLDIEPHGFEGIHTSRHHLLGNAMRLRKNERLRRDDLWRSELTAEELQTFERMAGDINRRYGYAD